LKSSQSEITGVDSKLVRLFDSVTYDFIAQIAVCDAVSGLQAVSDAMTRKNGGRGAEED
jgi:3-deoxy-D-manno-octulosonate 8-phosphate phosphatase KdsC-like HAD superfamily phosphatase